MLTLTYAADTTSARRAFARARAVVVVTIGVRGLVALDIAKPQGDRMM